MGRVSSGGSRWAQAAATEPLIGEKGLIAFHSMSSPVARLVAQISAAIE